MPKDANKHIGAELSPPDHHRPRVSINDHSPDVSGRSSPYGHYFQRKLSPGTDCGDGPVRKKSILHNQAHPQNHFTNHAFHFSEDEQHKWNDFHKNKPRGSVYSVKLPDAPENSWWFLFCTKCRSQQTTPSWEPPGWQRFCPHPYCPSYRQVARIIALSLIVLLIWGIVYCVLGDTAAPGGQLFGLAILCICAHFGGWLVTLVTLPALIGMLLTGILFQNVGLFSVEGEFKEVTSVLREIALVIILTRAGLDLDMANMRRLCFVVMRIGLVPWFIEFAVVAVMTHFIMGLPWLWAILLSSIIAAVSPAVVVPTLIRLRTKGYGVAKGIPTIIIAVSGIDDAASVAAFGIIRGLMFSTESLVFNIIQGPLSVVVGIGFGVFWGFLSKIIPEKQDPFAVPLRILMLFGGGFIAVVGSKEIGLAGAGPLAVVTAAFMCGHVWSTQGWDVEENPVAVAFEIFWMIFEPILFGITGTQIKFDELDGTIVAIGIGCLSAGIVIRILGTILVGIKAGLNLKEKIFVSLACMAKATVQAALAPVALEIVRKSNGSEEEVDYAEKLRLMCILAILLTAPLGAIIITITGPKLLTKMKPPSPSEEWRRRSHRPSIRDISIMAEGEFEDDENSDDKESEMQTELEEKEVAKKEDVSVESVDTNENKNNVP